MSRALFVVQKLSQSRQYKNYECQQSFFLLPSLPSLLFLCRVVSRLMGVQKTRFRCRSGQNGQIFRSHLSKIQVDIASNCCQMAKNDRILADERPLEHFLAILAHFMPIYTRIFEKRYRSVEVSERCVASTFLSFRNYLQSRQYKNYECQQSFFLLPSLPSPSLFSAVWFLGSWESKKPGFGVVPAKMGKSSGATFSKIQVDIASNCCQMAKNDQILADERPLEHFLAILAHFMPIYTRIFENGTARLRCPSGVSRALFCRSETISKVGNIKIMSASSPFFFSPSPLPSLFSAVWFLGSWESKKPGFGVVPAKMGKSSGATFSKIQVDIASNCCQMAKNDRILADERPLEHFLAILAHFIKLTINTRIFENGTARLRCPSGVSRALFCRSETISKVGNIKIMGASSLFSFSPLSPPFSFLCRVVSRLMGVQKTRFRCLFRPKWAIFRSHLSKIR